MNTIFCALLVLVNAAPAFAEDIVPSKLAGVTLKPFVWNQWVKPAGADTMGLRKLSPQELQLLQELINKYGSVIAAQTQEAMQKQYEAVLAAAAAAGAIKAQPAPQVAAAAPRRAQQRVAAVSSDYEQHEITAVLDDGSVLKLDDGSLWKVDGADTATSSVWVSATEVLLEGDSKIINIDDEESVAVKRIR